MKKYVIDDDYYLLDYLINKALFKRSKAKDLLKYKMIEVNETVVTIYNYELKNNDILIIKDKSDLMPTIDLPIIYEDESFIAINKPSGLLSISDNKESVDTAFYKVNNYMKNKESKRIYILHRLDKDTSGVLVFAKDEKIRDLLQDSWNEIVIKRGYYAIVEGKMDKEKDYLVNYIKYDKNDCGYISKEDKYSKKIITDYQVIKENDDYSLLDVNIYTGRKNQIRVALGNIGHYVIGDKKYGKPANPLKRLGLHAYELSFINPLNKKRYIFKADIPSTFNKLFK